MKTKQSACYALAIVVASALCLGCARKAASSGASAADSAQRHKHRVVTKHKQSSQFFALGVYWPWETALTVGNANFDQFLKTRMDDLAAHHVNVIWTMNGPDYPVRIKLLCKLAHERNIKLILGSGKWVMTQTANAQWKKGAEAIVESTWKDIPADERPIAFNISDEPQPGFWPLLDEYAKDLKSQQIPTTTVVQWPFTKNGADALPDLYSLAVDLYPFFDDASGPRGEASYAFFKQHATELIGAEQGKSTQPWIMPQGFQETRGPGRIEDNGFITILPGGGSHWLMPTPEQIRWEAWTSVALGAKGVVFFAYAMTGPNPNPQIAPLSDPTIKGTEYSTGGPLALNSLKFQPGPQYTELGAVYAQIEPVTSLLATLTPYDGSDVAKTQNPMTADVCSTLRSSDQTVYIGVCAAPERHTSMTLTLGRGVTSLEAVGGAPAVSVDTNRHTVTIPLTEGHGGFYKVSM